MTSGFGDGLPVGLADDDAVLGRHAVAAFRLALFEIAGERLFNGGFVGLAATMR